MNERTPLPEQFKGKRPQFFDDPAIDALLSMFLELSQETWVLRERMASLEAFLEHKGAASRAEFEAFALDPADQSNLAEQRQAFVSRLLRVLDQMA